MLVVVLPGEEVVLVEPPGDLVAMGLLVGVVLVVVVVVEDELSLKRK